jgi:hypothetical protein
MSELQQRLAEVEGQLAQASGELATARRSEVALRERLQVRGAALAHTGCILDGGGSRCRV